MDYREKDQAARDEMRRRAIESQHQAEKHFNVVPPGKPPRRMEDSGESHSSPAPNVSAYRCVPSLLARSSPRRLPLVAPRPAVAHPRPTCPTWDINENGKANVLLRKLNRLLRSLIADANAMIAATPVNNRKLWEDSNEHERLLAQVNIVPECPGGPEAIANLNEHEALLAEATGLGIKAMDSLFAAAAQALSDLRQQLYAVANERQRFETDGGGGLIAIQKAHDAFLIQLGRCGQFEIYEIMIDGKQYDPAPWYAELRQVVSDEKVSSAMDDLDDLRDEYVQRSICVPRRTSFTQNKASKRYSFAQLNVTNDYDWAILTDVLLENLDAIGAEMEALGYREQLNSVYRNPLRSSGRSCHQYGVAVDWQVFDFDHSGGDRNEVDWALLRDLVDKHRPGWIEPVADSTAGHVHADWRNSVPDGCTCGARGD